jgi:acetylornithine deacetylase/succinyl-diaminopimelate desuccinylase-like protein
MTNAAETSTEPPSDADAAILAECRADEVRDLTRDLVRIESHRSAPGQETATATHILELFHSAGIDAELREVRPGRPNVIATLPGEGGGPRLIFNGHTDTVPPGTMIDPFEPRIENGIMRGRGTADMKGGLAAQICAMLALKRSAARLDGDVVFTGVIAEEDGTSLGSLDIANDGPSADMVVVAEPTDLRIAIAHKGFDYYEIEVEGSAAHSSRPDKGVNAIYRAAEIVSAIEKQIVADLGDIKHPLLGAATVNVASIIGFARSEIATAFGRGPMLKPDGGTVPDTCTICLDHRRLPGGSHLDFVDRLQALIAGLGPHPDAPPPRVSFKPACPELDTHPPLDTDDGHALVRESLRIASAETGLPPEPVGVPYWSDAALFNTRWRVPAIVFGPGDIAVAHSNAEHVPVDQLLQATRINALLAATLLGGR